MARAGTEAREPSGPPAPLGTVLGVTDEPKAHLYEPRPLVGKAVRRLGESLAAERKLTEAEAALWQEFALDAFTRSSACTAAVSAALRAPVISSMLPRVAAAEITGRAKTRKTLVEKLQRTPQVKLPSVHDVAGVRVVGNFSLFEQVQAARVIGMSLDEQFEMSRPYDLVDRLTHDSFGYRAVHVVVWPEGRPIEIQIRTELQHAWAELMEVLGDRWGREPRYGLPVVHEDDHERDRRQSVVDALIAIAGNIADFERAAVGAALAQVHPPAEAVTAIGRDFAEVVKAQEWARQLEPETEAQRQNLLRALTQFRVDADLD